MYNKNSKTDSVKLQFSKKTWIDSDQYGTSITEEDMNRLEDQVNLLTESVNSIQNSISSSTEVTYENWVYRKTANIVLAFSNGSRATCEAYGTVTLSNIPEGYRPVRQYVGFCTFANGGNAFVIAQGTEITLRNLETPMNNMQYYACIAYPTS